MAFDSHAGANKLARTLQGRMKAVNNKGLVLDFGTIENDYGLITNTFPVKIPNGEYTVCRHIKGMELFTSGGTHGGHEEGDGSHSHLISVPGLRPGNRVLVAWVQNEACVVDVIA